MAHGPERRVLLLEWAKPHGLIIMVERGADLKVFLYPCQVSAYLH